MRKKELGEVGGSRRSGEEDMIERDSPSTYRQGGKRWGREERDIFDVEILDCSLSPALTYKS